MHLKQLILCCLILSAFPLSVSAFSFIDWLKEILHLSKNDMSDLNTMPDSKTYNGYEKSAFVMKRASNEFSDTDSWETNQIPATCDEDAILLPLARLKIISPEKIIELLATPSLEFTCERVNSTIIHVNKAIAACVKFPPNHLYQKLCDGLEYFSSTICVDIRDDERQRKNPSDLLQYSECYNQLKDDIYDCEGPPDWFEKKNRSAACQFYNDIIDCNYIKAAMLCGREAARLLRDFSNSVMRKVLTFPCKVSSSEPHMDESLIASSTVKIHLPGAYEAFIVGVFYFVIYKILYT